MKLFIEDQKVIPAENYPGKKTAAGQWQKILSEIPRCELFIDAMAGSGYIGSLLKNCQVVINDLDKACIDKIKFPGQSVEFMNLDYQVLIDRFDNGNRSRVFYFDPPYLMETRSYKKPIYKFDWIDKDHARFLKAVRSLKCPAIISHYPCPLYDKALNTWRKITYNTMTRAGARAESIYMNFPQPVLLQFYQHIGQNFTDRQRIKRKVDRLIKRLENEEAKERAAILSAVIDNFSYIKK